MNQEAEQQRRQQVITEVEGWKELYGKNWMLGLNNFKLLLPCSWYPEGSYFMHNAVILGIEDTPLRNLMGPKEREGMSEKLLNQTYREFHHTVIATANRLGITIEEIDKFQKQPGAQKKLYELTLPIYIELRVLGYSEDFLAQ